MSVCLSVCLSVCVEITLTFLHAFTSNFAYNLIPTPGKFSHAFRPTGPFLINAITQILIEATLPVFQTLTLIRLPCSGHVTLSFLRSTPAATNLDSTDS